MNPQQNGQISIIHTASSGMSKNMVYGNGVDESAYNSA